MWRNHTAGQITEAITNWLLPTPYITRVMGLGELRFSLLNKVEKGSGQGRRLENAAFSAMRHPNLVRLTASD